MKDSRILLLNYEINIEIKSSQLFKFGSSSGPVVFRTCKCLWNWVQLKYFKQLNLPALEWYFVQQKTTPDERTSSSSSSPRPRRRCGRSSRRRLEPTTETSVRRRQMCCYLEELMIGPPEVRSDRPWELASSQRHRNRIWSIWREYLAQTEQMEFMYIYSRKWRHKCFGPLPLSRVYC